MHGHCSIIKKWQLISTKMRAIANHVEEVQIWAELTFPAEIASRQTLLTSCELTCKVVTTQNDISDRSTVVWSTHYAKCLLDYVFYLAHCIKSNCCFNELVLEVTIQWNWHTNDLFNGFCILRDFWCAWRIWSFKNSLD